MEKNKIIGLLGLATRAGKVIFGYELVEKSIQNNKAKIVFVENIDSSNHKQIKNKCSYYNVALVETFSSDEISKATGKKTKIVSIIDEGFKEAIIKLL